FELRSFANGQGFYRNKKIENDFNFWAKANRLGGAFPIRVGHSYQTIVSNNAEVFKQHPEYFAGNIAKGELPSIPKFNVANHELVDLVIEDAKKRLSVFERTGQFMNMISMEPSDGGGFCSTPECMKIGTISDQVFYLTNAVAKAIQKDYPGIWVGNLAYNEHIEPTKYKLESNVFVMVTNGFNRTKFSTNELIKKWNKKAKKTGVYEYLSVYAWDNDLPGRSNASNLDFLKKSIQGYFESGARVYLAETTVGWISKGLGQYIASKLLWDFRLNVDSLANDFYKKCFGNASSVIKQLFESWSTYPSGLISNNALADWLSLIKEADNLVNDQAIKKRLDYIKIYMHYLVLFKKLKTEPTQENLHKIMNFAYRTFDVSAFATVPVMVSLPFYSGFKGQGLYDSNEHAWMRNGTPVSVDEVNKLFLSDLASIKRIDGLIDFGFVNKFTKAQGGTTTPKFKVENKNPSFTGETLFLIRIEKKSPENYFEIKSGYSARPENAKPVTVQVFKNLEYMSLGNEAEQVFSSEQSKKLITEKVDLGNLEAGDYIVKVDDQYKMFSIVFSPAVLYSVIMNNNRMIQTSSVTGLNTFYFSVLPKTKNIVIHKSKILKLVSPVGRLLDFNNNKQESNIVDIRENEFGIWQVFYQAGDLFIEGVPPYLGVTLEQMLLPVYKNESIIGDEN
ncbi:MAG: DUF4838 domain-containing protein, partial [Flavobacteriaceae bacterium]|nr:DUF4838 domain-containing protein [Flavobacteriaceae bacterium]